jgi:hypothetical protein
MSNTLITRRLIETSASVITALTHVANKKIWTKVKLITVKTFHRLGKATFRTADIFSDSSVVRLFQPSRRKICGRLSDDLPIICDIIQKNHSIESTFLKYWKPWWSFKIFLKCPMFEFRYSNILKTKFRSPICECLSRAHWMQLSMWKCTGKWWVSTWIWKSGYRDKREREHFAVRNEHNLFYSHEIIIFYVLLFDELLEGQDYYI